MPRPNLGPHLHWIERRRTFYIRWFEGGREKLRSTGTDSHALAQRELTVHLQRHGLRPIESLRAHAPTFVYFVGARAIGLVKIGTTNNIDDRLASLRCGSPVPLTLLAICPGSVRDEKDYHRRFAEHRQHGEWFKLMPDIEAEIARLPTANA